MSSTMNVTGFKYPLKFVVRPLDKVTSLSDSGNLTIPPFQREDEVWTDRQDQELIKSMIRKLKLPTIDSQKFSSGDVHLTNGQQRTVNAIRFLKGKIKIDKPKPATQKFKKDKDYYSKYGGKRFSSLPKDLQKQIKGYNLIFSETVSDDEEEERDYYIRVNTLGTNLNRAEINKANYFDTAFWKLAHSLSKKYRKFYESFHVLTDRQIGRSLDQLTTEECLVLIQQGAQSSGKLGSYYQQWGNTVPNKNEIVSELEQVYNIIKKVFPSGLARTRFNNPNNFYALVGAIHSNIKHSRKLKNPKTVNNNLTRFMSSVYNGTTAIGSKQYWETLQEGTKSKKHRQDRIRILCSKI